MLKQASGEKAMSRTQTHEWYVGFKGGPTSVEDSEHSGRPSA